MLLDDWLEQRATTCPDRVALLSEGSSLTYAQLEQEARSAARRLAGRGVRRGSLVGIELEPGIDFAVIIHALMKLGAVAYPLNTRMSTHERARELDRAELALLIRGLDDAAGPEADLPVLGEHDLGAVQSRILTSGTSGAPKPVDLTYGNQLWSAVGSAFNLGVDPSDRWLCCMPLYHVGGLTILMRSVIYGTGAVIHRGFDTAAVAESLRDDAVSLLSVVPTQLRRLFAEEIDLSRLRSILVGGAPVPRDLLDEAADRGARVVQTYGLTEACSQVTTLAPGDASRKPGSAGRALLTTHLRIADGEILVQGPTVAPGAADDEGWLHTGDLGWIDDEGFLYVTDRLRDLIVSGGENVMPGEVEGVLLGHPGVADAGVVGRSDREWGEAVVAVIVSATGSTPDEDELRAHCARLLASYKVPKRFEYVAELPRTTSGKLLRREL